ncbi:hypothetical protein B7C51_04610 [Paenibacillus larvae subsp. pulvifaciens]|uniref:Uncharacterized protein n=1 Tax=Paenibacillus larvae subsp. pulvifaciens TaxID=1477 RepID=A0A1V0UQ69_9BACL|nr:hypothetical protein [Paenibacillus larvae]ARF67256.1 hypothetical protein B7C51_04610 [Paenibacillus larvae subsp. pulvifaciens]
MEKTIEYCFHPVHQRLAQLYFKYGNFTQIYENASVEEFRNLEESLKLNAHMVRKLNELNSLSLIAYQINDMNWLHEICGKIEKLKESFLV